MNQQSHWHDYLHLRDLIEQLAETGMFRREFTNLEKIITLYPKSPKGLLSKLYRVLIIKGNPIKLSYQTKWEEELGVHWQETDWENIWDSPANRSTTYNIKMQFFKTMSRWYLTPQQIHKFSRSNSPMCWKRCGQEGTYLHCWWSCPKIQQFWSDVKQEIEDITTQNLSLSPESFLLNHWDGSVLDHKKELTSTLLAIARLAIAANWKSPAAPSVTDWQDKLWEHLVMAKIADSLRCSQSDTPHLSTFVSTWFPVVSYLQILDILPPNPLYLKWLTL